MFCYQCQEAAGCKACTVKGVCGKPEVTSDLQDLLVETVIRIAQVAKDSPFKHDRTTVDYVLDSLFVTITNANFDDAAIVSRIVAGRALLQVLGGKFADLPDTDDIAALEAKGKQVGIVSLDANEDLRSLKAMLLYGMKGIAAYAHHAAVYGSYDHSIADFLYEGLSALRQSLDANTLVGLNLKAGATAVTTMALLDKANTGAYGNPEITKVNIGVRNNPGILVSGHDLPDLEEILKQTEGTGVDVYTHSEMLPANYYPVFKKYKHLVGNYGNAWWKQAEEFASFNGPIIMTTNCIVPVKDSYKDRIFTTGSAGYPGVPHIADRKVGGAKDFSKVIALAKTCKAPVEIEKGEIVGGFAHAQVLALADKVIAAVKSGAVKRFVVMAGCDGRHNARSYFTEVAQKLPNDAIILTAGCAKYRYNKLPLGDIGGIPRVLDAGQCNDSYSLAVVALKLKEVFALNDINDLPISFDIGWYEQKAVAVLLALLHLGVKGIRLGPTLPAFVTPNIAKALVDAFAIKQTTTADADVAAMMTGK
jgi:hydroxylamine reductase